MEFLRRRSPFLFNFARTGYWKYRSLRERLIGTRLQERFWAGRHLIGGSDWKEEGKRHDWVSGYIESTTHPHRTLILETVSKYAPFESVLEVGCHCGPNLYLLAKQYPSLTAQGLDINPAAVKQGNEWLAREGLSRVELMVGRADDLSRFPDQSFDLLLTDAVLIYIGPDKIFTTVMELLRVTRRALVLVEWHSETPGEDSRGLGMYHFGAWKRNYRNLFRRFVAEDRIRLTKIPADLWPAKNWQELGNIIEIVKRELPASGSTDRK